MVFVYSCVAFFLRKNPRIPPDFFLSRGLLGESDSEELSLSLRRSAVAV